jgi:hypothetical protein
MFHVVQGQKCDVCWLTVLLFGESYLSLTKLARQEDREAESRPGTTTRFSIAA